MTAAAGAVVLGIDPGRRWTAGVLRAGDRALYGWTVGPVGPDGLPSPAAVDDVDDVGPWAVYMRRILDAIELTMDRHRAAGGGRVHLAVEVMEPPGGRKIALADWLIPRQVMAGVLTYDPDAILIRPKRYGKARPVTEHYPPELWPAKPGGRGGRPPGWGPNEARRNERDHERAAWDIAGAGAVVLARRAAERAAAERVGDVAGGTAGR